LLAAWLAKAHRSGGRCNGQRPSLPIAGLQGCATALARRSHRSMRLNRLTVARSQGHTRHTAGTAALACRSTVKPFDH
jgi:hypothetical protein